TMTENLLLEYANGFRGRDLGWGRLDRDALVRVLQLHTTYADLVRRTPFLARARGSRLAATILRSLQQAVTGAPVTGAPGRPGGKLLVVSGHDTNISNLSGMLQLSWHLSGYQRDDVPPGAALVWSVWRAKDGRTYTVRTQFVSQSLDQMRDGSAVTVAAPP